jgi:hypothetical protein
MTITIHIGSLIFGICLGGLLSGTIYWLICAKGNEFSEGWNFGKHYAEMKQKEQTDESDR